ncbi:MAG: complex I NDUFA9 subunit family protein [Proteobacteria bacterium]|nr:complex I NDUFA9 subunit family protein [Pseudomonadota bacterium]
MTRHVITVFGGSGFVGRHLVRKLAADGWTVRAVCRDPEAANFLRTMGDVGQVLPWGGDIRDPASVERAVAGANAAVNLVGILYQRGRSNFEALHVDGARHVAEAAAKAGLSALVHVSAIGADLKSGSAYGRSKAAGEAAVKAAFPKACIMRPSIVFGPEDNFFNQFAGICRISPILPVFGTFGLPRVGGRDDAEDIPQGPKFQPIYVGDLAAAIVASLENQEAAGETYTLGGPTQYSFGQLMHLMLTIIGRKRLLQPVPFAAAEVLGFFLQLLPKPLLTVDQVRMMKTDNVRTQDAPGLVQLGISPTPLEAVLPNYLCRYRIPTGQAQLTG